MDAKWRSQHHNQFPKGKLRHQSASEQVWLKDAEMQIGTIKEPTKQAPLNSTNWL